LTEVEIGRVARPHGVRGELKIHLHWAGSEALLQVDEVLVGQAPDSRRAFAVEGARRAGKALLLKLRGIDDRDGADALRGAAVAVDRSALPALGEGEYYLCDLLGAVVIAPSGPVGRVVEVRPYPSVDCVVIEMPDGRRLEQPLSEPWLSAVDVAEGRIHLSSTDGLIE